MAYKGTFESTNKVETEDLGLCVEDMKMTAKARRRIFERRWYDNNFFDDGFHFRYLSRSSNKIVDLSERATIYTPQRSIPKSSRQIRGVSNLLMSSDPTPTVYPDPINKTSFADPDKYALAQEYAKRVAQKRGMWLLNEWKKDDGSGDTVLDKVALMTLLTMKHGISYMQVWPDEVEEKIRTQVYDAFDIYILGNLTSIYQAPFLIKCVPLSVAEIKANKLFDKAQLEQLNPDNRKASSEIKEAYLQARYGRDTTSDQGATLILNEGFMKEYVDEDNIKRIRQQEDGDKVMKGKDMGSPIIRQVFTAGGVWLYDNYTALDEYPFIDYRMEPGPLYQVPLIERFMPANKSLDSVISRVERYTHTMVTGSWLKRRGENFKINNIAGGQMIEYDATPPVQNQIAPIPPFVYEFIGLLTNFIEEQGVSTTTLGKLPEGVRANAAIESLKESEYANLVIAQRRLKSMMTRLAKKFLEIADEHFVTEHQVTSKDQRGEVNTFAVMGAGAMKARKKIKVQTPYDVISLSKDTQVDIQIEQGMAYTKEGQKAIMQQVMNTMAQLLQLQAIPPQAIQIVAQKYLEQYQFGATQEFMDTIDEAFKNGPNLTEQQLVMLKTAVLEALKDAGEIGPEGDQNKVQATKVGVLEALQQSGLAKNLMTPVQPAKESVSIPYKDLPEDVKRQAEAKAGFTPSQQVSPVVTDQMLKHAQAMTEMRKSQVEQQQAQMAQQQAQQPKGGRNE